MIIGISKDNDPVVENWLGWSENNDKGMIPVKHYQMAQRESVPAALRRRLSPTGLATCTILSQLVGDDDIPILYVSRHGRVANTLTLLRELALEGCVSPSRFSLSVHNAVAGIYSIAQHHINSIQAISASGNEMQALLMEATAYLREGASAVVAVFVEEAFPDVLHGHARGPTEGCAVGIRFSLNAALQQYPQMPALPGEGGSSAQDLLRWLGNHSPSDSRVL